MGEAAAMAIPRRLIYPMILAAAMFAPGVMANASDAVSLYAAGSLRDALWRYSERKIVGSGH
jgi:hypothetical protein